jgi:hypothetical protein
MKSASRGRKEAAVGVCCPAREESGDGEEVIIDGVCAGDGVEGDDAGAWIVPSSM